MRKTKTRKVGIGEIFWHIKQLGHSIQEKISICLVIWVSRSSNDIISIIEKLIETIGKSGDIDVIASMFYSESMKVTANKPSMFGGPERTAKRIHHCLESRFTVIFGRVGHTELKLLQLGQILTTDVPPLITIDPESIHVQAEFF